MSMGEGALGLRHRSDTAPGMAGGRRAAGVWCVCVCQKGEIYATHLWESFEGILHQSGEAQDADDQQQANTYTQT